MGAHVCVCVCVCVCVNIHEKIVSGSVKWISKKLWKMASANLKQ